MPTKSHCSPPAGVTDNLHVHLGTPRIINKGLGEILSPCFFRAESAPHPISHIRPLIVPKEILLAITGLQEFGIQRRLSEKGGYNR
jgi:hypothetical protein